MAQHVKYCDFCEKSNAQVRRVITGPGVAICDECVALCVEILVEYGITFESLPNLQTKSARELGFSPIFPEVDVERRARQCFYLGPFCEPFNTIYRDHVGPALDSVGVKVERADEIFGPNVIIEDIWRGINSAGFVVADLTTKNANVLYEVGMAHTVGRPVVIVTQSIDDVPFDLRHRRCIVYEYTPRGCEQLEEQLSATARFLLGATGHATK